MISNSRLRLAWLVLGVTAVGDIAALAVVEDDRDSAQVRAPASEAAAPTVAPGPAASTTPSAVPAATAPVEVEKAPDGKGAVQGGSQAKGSTASTAPAPSTSGPPPDPGPKPTPDLDVTVTVTPTCATRGQTVKATVKTVAEAWLAFSVAYSNGQSHRQQGTGQVDRTGVFEYSWEVPVTAAPGQASFLVSAYDTRENRSGVRRATFTVAEVVC